jgi:hypothetical protein
MSPKLRKISNVVLIQYYKDWLLKLRETTTLPAMQKQDSAIEWESGFFLTLVVVPNPSDGLPTAEKEGSGSLTEPHGSPGGGRATQEAEDMAAVGR